MDVESVQYKAGVHQQVDQIQGVLEGQVGGDDPRPLGVQGLALRLPPLAPLGRQAGAGFRGRPRAEVLLVRPAVDPDAPVVVPSATFSVLPRHAVVLRSSGFPARCLPYSPTGTLVGSKPHPWRMRVRSASYFPRYAFSSRTT